MIKRESDNYLYHISDSNSEQYQSEGPLTAFFPYLSEQAKTQNDD